MFLKATTCDQLSSHKKPVSISFFLLINYNFKLNIRIFEILCFSSIFSVIHLVTRLVAKSFRKIKI